VSEDLNDALTGHSGGGVGRAYGAKEMVRRFSAGFTRQRSLFLMIQIQTAIATKQAMPRIRVARLIQNESHYPIIPSLF
jgi:hypothetical protein